MGKNNPIEYLKGVLHDIIKGKTMNDVYMLTGNNKYPDDCTIVSIKLEDMENSMAVVIPRFNIGARWLDDIVMNNATREK